jgi:hypothetical protein
LGGTNPAVQYGLRAGHPFPAGVFEQPTYNRETNRDSASISSIIGDLRQQLEPQGFQLETSFEADPLGGRHVVRVKKDNETIGQPFRLTATPSGVPLISKTGKSAGGYRLIYQGGGLSLSDRLSSAILQMAANDQAYKAGQASRAASAGDDGPDDASEWPKGRPKGYMPAWMLEEKPPAWDEVRLLTPVVSKGTVYPLEARNFIAGNIELEDGRQWGSQKGQGKQMKRDELSLTRKYWQAGPALGVAYPETPQHILGQRSTEPEMAHIAQAFIGWQIAQVI